MGELRTSARYLVDSGGTVAELASPMHPALGSGDAMLLFEVTERRLQTGEIDPGHRRHPRAQTEAGGVFGAEGIRKALAAAENPTAGATAMAILQAVTECWREPLEDDGTVVVLAVN